MPKIEEGKRFTDLAYASKDEVKAIYNKDDISKEWGKGPLLQVFLHDGHRIEGRRGKRLLPRSFPERPQSLLPA